MNIAAVVQDLIDRALAQFLFVATVVTAGAGVVTVKPLGSQYAINQSLVILASYAGAAPNDVVLVARVGSGYWVLGKVG